MRKFTGTVLAATAAVTLVVGLMAAPAQASGTKTRAASFWDATAFTPRWRVWGGTTLVTCSWHTMSGSWSPFTSPSALTASSTFVNCGGPFGLMFDLTHNGFWNLRVEAPTADPDVTQMRFWNVDVTFSGAGCSGRIGGDAPARYDSVTEVLSLDPWSSMSNLRAFDVSGCFGLVRNGDLVEWDGDYQVTPPF